MTAAAAALALAMTVCACGKKEEKTTFTGDQKEALAYQDNLNAISPAAYNNVQGLNLEPGTYISIIGKDENSAYWKNVKAGVMQAADDLNEALGYTGNDKIKVTYNAPAKTEDIDEQVNILDEELARYPNVIGIASIDADACTVQFDLATENGIPIISLDSGSTYQGIQCSVKTDNAEAARTGAYKLADEIEGSGELLLLIHDSQSETAKVREQSFSNEIETNYPNVKIVEKIYCDKLNELKKQIAEEKNAELSEGEKEITADSFSDEDVIMYYLDKHPDVKGVFGTNNAATQLGMKALQEAEKAAKSEQDTEKAAKSEKDTEKATESEQDTEKAAESEKDTEKATESEQDTEKAVESEQNTEQSDKAETEETGGTEGNTESGETDVQQKAEKIAAIVLMGFDAGEDQLSALESGEISGLVVQNPFGIGYASVVAAARTVLEIGNEAEVNTGYIWVTKDNMQEESIQRMLYW